MSEEQKSYTVEEFVALTLAEAAIGLLGKSRQCVGVSMHIGQGSPVMEVAFFASSEGNLSVSEILEVPRGWGVDNSKKAIELESEQKRLDEARSAIDGRLSEIVARYQNAIADAHRRERD